MIQRLRKTAGPWAMVLGIIVTGLLAGCKTGPHYSDLPPETMGIGFHLGDQVTVSFLSQSGDPTVLPPFSGRIQGDGTITLSLIGPVTAVGKTEGQLQMEIHEAYVPRFFPGLNVNVKGETTYFYVDGEVASRGQKDYPGEMTIVKAIAAAGGFTDFAKKTKVRLTRGNHTENINVQKAISDPHYDVPVYPGDKIWVPRKIF